MLSREVVKLRVGKHVKVFVPREAVVASCACGCGSGSGMGSVRHSGANVRQLGMLSSYPEKYSCKRLYMVETCVKLPVAMY